MGNSRQKMALPVPVLATLVLACSGSVSADTPFDVSAAYYLDGRGFATASLGVATDELPIGLSLWGFTDVHGDHNSDSLVLTRSFSEYRLSHGGVGEMVGIDGLGLQIESNVISGSGNDVVRSGLTYRHTFGKSAWLQWRAFPLQSDDNDGQLSLIYWISLNDQLSLGGFADYNLVAGGSNRWVVEPELRLTITDNLSALLEYRYNQFEQSAASLRGSSIALGVRYRFTQ